MREPTGNPYDDRPANRAERPDDYEDYVDPNARREEEILAREKASGDERTIELREERLVPRKTLEEAGQIRVHKEVEEFPGRLEVEALRQEVDIEHVPMGQVVSERVDPWDENGVLVVPVYEEQLVVVKRLVMKEQLRIRRVETREHQVYEEPLRRERAVVDDPDNTGLLRERYSTERTEEEKAREAREDERPEEGGFMENLGKRLLS